MEWLAAGSLAVARLRCTELPIIKHVWRVFLVMLLAVFCVDGWSAIPDGCRGDDITCRGALGQATCRAACHCDGPYNCQMNQSAIVGKKYDQTTSLGVQEYCVVTSVDENCRDITTTRASVICCGARCARERIQCELKGWVFVDSTCECLEPCDQTLCDNYQSQCAQMQGTFTGDVRRIDGACCCVANCNTCSKEALKTKMEQKTKQCCSQGLAPPEDTRRCSQMLERGCGMSVPVLTGESGDNWACRDPNLSNQALTSFVENCYGSSSSTAGSSSGGVSSDGGGTSDGGGSSGGTPPYPEGCDECPWLDSILDTLTAQKSIVGAIYDCMYVPNLCNTEQTTSDPFQFDTAWYNYVKPLLDTSLHLDTLTLVELEKLDTNMLKMLENDLEKLKNDTLLRYSLTAGFAQNSSDLANVRNEVNHMNDSTRKWLKRLADSLRVFNDSNRTYLDRVADTIGISTDSLIAHLDSIKRNIPRDVLDSILKYQKMLAESEDSVVLGSLPSIDSLIDSTVKYFKQAREFDSIRHVQMSDSLQALHEAIDGMSYRISQILGYGDTASTDLRGDLNSINSSVNTFRDSVLKYYGSFVSADSSYHVTFKDSVESVHGTLNEIKDSLTSLKSEFEKGSYDTNSTYNSYLSGHDTAAVNFINNAAAAMGGALASSAYDGIFDLSSNSSAASSGNYALMNLDSANAVMRASNDSMKSALADTMQTWFDELRKDFVLVNFDSAIIAPLGAKVPNTNTCPESCFAIDLSAAGGIFSGMQAMNWGLCKPIIGSLNVFEFIRLILRIVTALTCVYIGMWFISGKK